MSSEILFLAHRIPFPPDRGDKIRSHHILKALAQIAPVHVACFADTGTDWDQMGELAEIAESHTLVARRKPLAIAGVEALLRREPVSISAFRHEAIERYVGEVLASRPIGTIYVYSGQMGQYVPEGFSGRVVVDLVDVDSAKFEAYAERSHWPLSRLQAREGKLLRAVEEGLARRADRCLLVSEAEAHLFQSRLVNPARAKLAVLTNGIDVVSYDPGAVSPEPALKEAHGPHLVFTGQMDYPPNIAAARRVIDYILPAIRQHHPYAQFHIVGRAPTSELLAFDWKDGVRVWGEVPDVKPFLAAADVIVAPLEIARGVQNKVLEGMAMARPVVLTSGAATGIGADDGKHFAVEDSDEGMTARIHSLLANRGAAQTMGQAARQYVVDLRSWEATLAPLPRIVGFGEAGRGSLNAA